MKIIQAHKVLDNYTLEPKIVFSGEYSLSSAIILDPSMSDSEFLIMIGQAVMNGIKEHLDKNEDKND